MPCPVCKKQFAPRKNQLTCSHPCGIAYRLAKKEALGPPRDTKVCEVCKRTFVQPKGLAHRYFVARRFCDRTCMNKARQAGLIAGNHPKDRASSVSR